MKLSEIINATGASVINNYSEDFDVNISTDTRTLNAGDFYLPLKGESFDGEKFVFQALQKGAIGAFVTSDKIDIKEYQNKCILKVENTLVAYLKFFLLHYIQWQHHHQMAYILQSDRQQ